MTRGPRRTGRDDERRFWHRGHVARRRRRRAPARSPTPRVTRSRRRAGGAPRRSPRTASSTCSGPATPGYPWRRCSPATARIPGFNPIVELSMTFHTQVVGANGQRQAMFIERMPGLAEVILGNFRYGPHDVMIVFSASGLTAVPVEMAKGARARGLRVIAVTSVAQSLSASRSLRPAAACWRKPISSSTCAHPTQTPSWRSPGSIRRSARAPRSGPSPSSTPSRSGPPSSSWSNGRCPPSSRARAWVGAERSRTLFDEAYREHARRLAHAIDQRGGG